MVSCKNGNKIGTHCIHVVSSSGDLVDQSKHYIHEIDALVSLNSAECFALQKSRKNSYIVVRKSLV